MECPVCACELRLAERVPAALAGAFVYVQCSEPRCHRSLVAHLPAAEDGASAEPRLLTPVAAFREERRAISERNALDRAMTGVVAAGCLVFGILSGALIIGGERGDRTAAITTAASFFAVFVVTAAIVAGGFYLDTLLAAHHWSKKLRVAKLSFVAPPKAYRL